MKWTFKRMGDVVLEKMIMYSQEVLEEENIPFNKYDFRSMNRKQKKYYLQYLIRKIDGVYK